MLKTKPNETMVNNVNELSNEEYEKEINDIANEKKTLKNDKKNNIDTKTTKINHKHDIIGEGIHNIANTYLDQYKSINKTDNLINLPLSTIQKLFSSHTNNYECLLYFLNKEKKKDDEEENEEEKQKYTKNMINLFEDCYELPLLSNDNNTPKNDIETNGPKSNCPADELFIWSLLLYSGNESEFELIKHYWSLSKYPIACCLIAKVIINKCQNENYISDELKEKIEKLNEKFEDMANSVIHACYENEKMIFPGNELMITQDLLLREIKIFKNNTVLDIAIKAEALDFLYSSAIQDLINEMWYECMDPDSSNWKILACLLCLPLTMCPINLFKKKLFNRDESSKNNLNIRPLSKNAIEPQTGIGNVNKKQFNDINIDKNKSMNQTTTEKSKPIYIPNRLLKFRVKPKSKLFAFISAPIIKFIFHFVFYIFFLIIYHGFVLFDYYPVTGLYPTGMTEYNVDSKFGVLKITITEALLIAWVIMFQMDYLRQLIFIKNPKIFFNEDPWNIYDIFCFLTFYAAIILRFIPKTTAGCLSTTETCFEAGRVLYCVSLILWSARTLKFLCVLSFWGPKLIIIAKMIKQLLLFIVILVIFVLPFAASFKSIMNKTSLPDISVITDGLNSIFWPIFGELGGLLGKIENIQCPNGQCSYGLYSLFLYIGLAVYIIICNLLLLNMIIAIFGATVEETQAKSKKIFNFQKYGFFKQYCNSTIIPAPFIFIEFFILIIISLVKKCNNNNNDFRIILNDNTENEYNHYEQFYLKSYIQEKSNDENKIILSKLDEILAHLKK